MSDRVAVEAMIASIMDGFHRRLDIVVANAYYSKRQPLLEQVATKMNAAIHGRANRSGWDFRVFPKSGLQNLVRKRASLWPGFVRNLTLVFVPGFTVGHPNLSG